MNNLIPRGNHCPAGKHRNTGFGFKSLLHLLQFYDPTCIFFKKIEIKIIPVFVERLKWGHTCILHKIVLDQYNKHSICFSFYHFCSKTVKIHVQRVLTKRNVKYSQPWWCKSLCHVWLFATPWTVAHQAPLSMGISR